MDRIFKTYMIFKFSEFVIRSLFSAGSPYTVRLMYILNLMQRLQRGLNLRAKQILHSTGKDVICLLKTGKFNLQKCLFL